MSTDVEEHVLKNYDIRRRIGKGVRYLLVT